MVKTTINHGNGTRTIRTENITNVSLHESGGQTVLRIGLGSVDSQVELYTTDPIEAAALATFRDQVTAVFDGGSTPPTLTWAADLT